MQERPAGQLQRLDVRQRQAAALFTATRSHPSAQGCLSLSKATLGNVTDDLHYAVSVTQNTANQHSLTPSA
jgi:hypothetical protein